MSEQPVQRQHKIINPSLNAAMWEYIENDDVQKLAQLLEGPVIPQIDSVRHGMSPLLEALFRNKYDIAKLLIKAGANLHKKDRHDNTALMYAIDNPDIVKLLIAKKVNLDQENETDSTALMLAAEKELIETMKLLIDAGADLDRTNYEACTALTFALISENAEIIQLLLRAGADPFMGETMEELLLRTDLDNPWELRLFISEGVNPQTILETIVKVAEENDWDNEQVEQTIEKINKLTEERKQKLEESKKEIASGANNMALDLANIVAEYGVCQPHEIRKRKAPEPDEEEEKTTAATDETQQPAKRQKASPVPSLMQEEQRRMDNLLLNGMKQKNTTPNQVREWLDMHAQLGAQDKEGYTPLMLAVIYNRPDFVDILLERINQQAYPQGFLDMADTNSDTALAWAKRMKRNDIIAKLLRAGASNI